jgi:hypothetical protein
MKKKIFGGIAAIAIAAIAFTAYGFNTPTSGTLSIDDEKATCTFSKVIKDQATNELKCSGHGTLCCTMS